MKHQIEKAIERIKETIGAANVLENEPMSSHTSFRIGGPACALVYVNNEEELSSVLSIVETEGATHMLIGNGSNLLVSDEGYPGIAIKLAGEFEEIKQHESDKTLVTVGAARLMSSTAAFLTEHGLAGFEFASGIPGSIGGALFMNAGAYGGEMKDIVVCAEVMSRDGESCRTVPAEEMELAYRHSVFEETGEIILSVTYRLHRADRDAIAAEMKDLAARRNSKQPVQYPSAGSFFKRPEGYFAGKLIQDAGLKGLAVGGAQVSDLHAGFIINRGDATATDILQLMHLVQNTVYDQFGVRLEPEVRIIGEGIR